MTHSSCGVHFVVVAKQTMVSYQVCCLSESSDFSSVRLPCYGRRRGEALASLSRCPPRTSAWRLSRRTGSGLPSAWDGSAPSLQRSQAHGEQSNAPRVCARCGHCCADPCAVQYAATVARTGSVILLQVCWQPSRNRFKRRQLLVTTQQQDSSISTQRARRQHCESSGLP